MEKGRNAELVRQFYAVAGRGDIDGAMALVDDEAEYVNPASAVESGVRRGAAEFRAAMAGVLEGWDRWVGEPERLIERGDEVIAVVRYEARGRGSTLPIEGRESALFRLRHGKIVRYAWFHGPDDALEAAGGGGTPT